MAISICDVHLDPKEKETTVHGSQAFPIACYEDNMKQITVPIHWHEEFEYLVVTRGQVSVNLGGEKLQLQEGEAVFINSGCLHAVESYEGEGESLLRSLVILPKLIGGTSDSRIWQLLISPFQGADAPAYLLLTGKESWKQEVAEKMLLAWDAIRREIYDYENQSRYWISAAMHILVDHQGSQQLGKRQDNSFLYKMKKALSYVEEHYREDFGIQELMECCQCSESALLRGFHQIVGTSPMQYVMWFRLDKAKEQLLSGDVKVGEIAGTCGFRDVSYFTKLFKRETGMTPGAFRKYNCSSGKED